MTELINCLEIDLYQSQFRLTPRELAGLRQFNVFMIKVYLKAWFVCPSVLSAPPQDLELLQQLVQYKATNEVVANAALNNFLRHPWYLNETMICLAFFDDSIEIMFAALSLGSKDEPCKRIQMEHKDIGTKKLSYFVTTNTRQFFVVLDIPQDFLHQHPSEWKLNSGYIQSLRCVKAVKAVNDAAEHRISLTQSLNAAITNQEEQK